MITEQIYNSVIEGNIPGVEAGTKAALAAGMAPQMILNQALIRAMDEVGYRFEKGDFFVPEMLIAARAMKAGMDLLKPLLVDSGIDPVGKVVIGTVKGDLHDIGKNLVAMMLEGAGFEIVDLGTDVTPEAFVAAASGRADIVALSATMPSMEKIIHELNVSGLRDQVKIIVGGAPVTYEYAEKIGADGYAADASQAVKLAKTLIS
jgi:5-methyltetrahydrofolate--homocysteine methyltransferase